MNRFNQIYYAAVVFVFVFACNIAHGIHINDINPSEYHWESMTDLKKNYDPTTYHIEYLRGLEFFRRRKRGFFWSDDDDDDDKETTATSTTTTTTTTAVTTTDDMAATTTVDVMNIVIIGGDVESSLVVAAPYLPLVNKVATHVVPGLSPYEVVTLSVNVAALITRAFQNNERGWSLQSTVSTEDASKTPAEEASGAWQTRPDPDATFGNYATEIYSKLKDAFESHFGPVPKLFVDGETIESPAQTDSIFDKVKSKMYIVHSYINDYDAPDTENDENKIETTVTKMRIEGSQPLDADTIVTKTYESGVETLHQLTNDESNHVEIATKLIEDGKTMDKKISNIKNEMNSNESSSDESNDSDDDDHDENIIDYDVEIKEEDFNKVMEESMDLQPDFVKTLSGEDLLKHIDELQKSLPNSNIDGKNVFKALTERMDFDEDVSDDQINELVNALGKTTNYFISTALEKEILLTTPPMS